jgi:cell division protein FtsB
MIGKRKKGDFKKDRISHILFPIFTLSLIGLLLISNLKINQKKTKLQQEIASLKKELEVLEEKKQKLEKGLSQTEKESYWEEKIRQEGYVREGEKPVVILPPKESSKEEVVENHKLPETFWEKIKDFFVGLVGWFNNLGH